jgi:hypothetical protein
MCSATRDVRFGPKADIDNLSRLARQHVRAPNMEQSDPIL